MAETQTHKIIDFGTKILANRLRSVGSSIELSDEESLAQKLSAHVAVKALEIEKLTSALTQKESNFTALDTELLQQSCLQKITTNAAKLAYSYIPENSAQYQALKAAVDQKMPAKDLDDLLNLIIISSAENAAIVWQALLDSYGQTCDFFWVKPDPIVQLKYTDLVYV